MVGLNTLPRAVSFVIGEINFLVMKVMKPLQHQFMTLVSSHLDFTTVEKYWTEIDRKIFKNHCIKFII